MFGWDAATSWILKHAWFPRHFHCLLLLVTWLPSATVSNVEHQPAPSKECLLVGFMYMEKASKMHPPEALRILHPNNSFVKTPVFSPKAPAWSSSSFPPLEPDPSSSASPPLAPRRESRSRLQRSAEGRLRENVGEKVGAQRSTT